MKKKFTEIKEQVLEQYNNTHSQEIFNIANRMGFPEKKVIPVRQGNKIKEMEITRVGLGPLQTPYGDIWLFNFEINDEWSKYSVLIKCPNINYDTLKPEFSNSKELILRIDSGCETGHIFLDNTCECPDQLRKTMEQVINNGEGIIISIPAQDGRGKGSAFKLATLFLQKELGLNTVESAAYLSGDEDLDVRTYYGIIAIIKYLDIDPTKTKINLATNNPDKLNVFCENNFVVQKTPLLIEPTEHTAEHLKAKKNHLNHELK